MSDRELRMLTGKKKKKSSKSKKQAEKEQTSVEEKQNEEEIVGSDPEIEIDEGEEEADLPLAVSQEVAELLGPAVESSSIIAEPSEVKSEPAEDVPQTVEEALAVLLTDPEAEQAGEDNDGVSSKEIFAAISEVEPLDLPSELPKLEDLPKSKSKSKSKSSSASKEKTPSKSKSRSSSKEKSQDEVMSMKIHPDVSKSIIGSAEFMQDLTKHIRTKSINSAKECLAEINAFREIQIEKLLNSQIGEEKLESLKQLRERLQSWNLKSKQPEGSFKQIVNDIVGGYRLAHSENNDQARKLADGYLEWIAFQLDLTIPKGRRGEASRLINSQFNKLLYPQSKEWVMYQDGELILDREGIVRAAIQSADREQSEVEQAQQEKVKKRQTRQKKKAEASVEREKSVEREIRRRVREEQQEDNGEEVGEVAHVQRKKLVEQFLSTLFLTTQMIGQTNALFDDLDLDRMPNNGTPEQWKEYCLGLRQHIEPFEKLYDQWKTKSDPFFTEYKEDERYSLPIPERSIISVSQEKMTQLMRHKNSSKAQTKAATLFLLNWIEDMYRAFIGSLEDFGEKGPTLADNFIVERDSAQFDDPAYNVSAQKQTVKLTAKHGLTPNERAKALFAISFSLAWLADNENQLFNIKADELDLQDNQVAGNLTDVRDWIRNNLCMSISDNKACKTLFKSLKEITGEPRNNLDKLLKKKLDNLGLRIIEGGKEERKSINFEQLCAQCKTDDKTCETGYFAADFFSKTKIVDEKARLNAHEYARALEPNHWLLKRAVSGKGDVPAYKKVDLRQNGVLLIAVKTDYQLSESATLKGKLASGGSFSIEISSGKWKTTDDFVESFNKDADGALILSVKTKGEAEFPEFSLKAADNIAFSIEETDSSLPLLYLMGMRFPDDSTVKTKGSSKNLIATNRSVGFLLAVKSDTTFPKGDSPNIRKVDSDKLIPSSVLSDSIEIDAVCTGDELDEELKSIILLWLLSRPELVGRLVKDTAEGLLILDLPKKPAQEEFESTKSGEEPGLAVTFVNDAEEWKFWSDTWKFSTGFPKELMKKPSGKKPKRIYALNREVAEFDKIQKWKFEPSSPSSGPVTQEIVEKGPYSEKNAIFWSGFMLRKIPIQSELLAIAKDFLKA